LAEIKEKDEEGAVWEKSEAFMIELSKIPNVKTRLNLWSFIYDYDENKEGIITSIKSFQMVLYVNYLNP